MWSFSLKCPLHNRWVSQVTLKRFTSLQYDIVCIVTPKSKNEWNIWWQQCLNMDILYFLRTHKFSGKFAVDVIALRIFFEPKMWSTPNWFWKYRSYTTFLCKKWYLKLNLKFWNLVSVAEGTMYQNQLFHPLVCYYVVLSRNRCY